MVNIHIFIHKKLEHINHIFFVIFFNLNKNCLITIYNDENIKRNAEWLWMDREPYGVIENWFQKRSIL